MWIESNIGLAEKFVPYTSWKNTHKLFVQPNIVLEINL